MFINKKIITSIGFTLLILGGCATAKSALDGRLDANLGGAVKANIQAHAIAPTPAQKANTYIPVDPSRAATARENYRENTVKEPVTINQKEPNG